MTPEQRMDELVRDRIIEPKGLDVGPGHAKHAAAIAGRVGMNDRAATVASEQPLVSLGQGDYRRDIYPAPARQSRWSRIMAAIRGNRERRKGGAA